MISHLAYEAAHERLRRARIYLDMAATASRYGQAIHLGKAAAALYEAGQWRALARELRSAA